MTADVVSLDERRLNWRPVKEVCFWCGYACTAVVSEKQTATTRQECGGCGLFAAVIVREPPNGWQYMTDDELSEHSWGADE